MKLRNYQQAAHDAAISWIKKSTDPCIIEAETGSGKSHIIAAIAKTFYNLSGKHVLCTAPSVDLVRQNAAKFEATGDKASFFSASIGKSLKYPVIFGTPMTIKNQIHRFCNKFGLIVCDEAHGVTPTIKNIIEEVRSRNHQLRVIGLSATPSRLGTGFIYAMDEHDRPCREDQCVDPYFTKKIFTIGGRELIEQGFLTPPIIGAIHAGHYDTIGMQLNSMGRFAQSDIDKAYNGQGRKTAQIIADIIAQSKDRRGVMIFAATVQHADECMGSLPKELSRLITGKTKERARYVEDFKQQRYKYLVSVGTMTTGVDFTHVDVIAILRATESVGLLRQIVGRGTRLHEDKKDFLVLDYAENMDRHCPDGDIFNPKIKAYKNKESGEGIKAVCEICNTENEFSARPNEECFKIDENGFFIDLDGNRLTSEFGPIPAHFGRRCFGLVRQKNGKHERCEYRWTFKPCPHCEAENDMAARYCYSCKGEIVDPNSFLVIEYRRMKKDPYQMQCDKVLSWDYRKTLSKAGNECLAVDFVTPARAITVWFQVRSDNKFLTKEYEKFTIATKGMDEMPFSITYKKDIKTDFYRIHAYNQQPDDEPKIVQSVLRLCT